MVWHNDCSGITQCQRGIMPNFKILIADRNRNVREFLRREFREAGYRAQVAKDGREILSMMEVSEPPDLVILDPEIPDVEILDVVQRLATLMTPVVVHSFIEDTASELKPAALVEKKGDTQDLKDTVSSVLRRWYPQRFYKQENAT